MPMTHWVKTVKFRRRRESFKIQTGEDVDASGGMSSSEEKSESDEEF